MSPKTERDAVVKASLFCWYLVLAPVHLPERDETCGCKDYSKNRADDEQEVAEDKLLKLGESLNIDCPRGRAKRREREVQRQHGDAENEYDDVTNLVLHFRTSFLGRLGVQRIPVNKLLRTLIITYFAKKLKFT